LYVPTEDRDKFTTELLPSVGFQDGDAEEQSPAQTIDSPVDTPPINVTGVATLAEMLVGLICVMIAAPVGGKTARVTLSCSTRSLPPLAL
jgi:hypothetical protein